jgi:adenine-specific DNA-methyltransferase
MSKYKDLSKEELLKLIEKQEAELKSKKYGLVWDAEREPEQVVLDCESNLPVLKRVKGKEIKTNDEQDNILIEGDNYHALTVLNYTHKEKIDVIYIDPPYNTGNKDFVYNDRYVDKEDGYRHSKWLNFMEKRLNLAKNLLKETGVIFISIDDNEVAQLKMLCDKIFGEDNFIAQIVWQKKYAASNDSKTIASVHEYILCYTVSINGWKPKLFKRSDDLNAKYKNPDNDIRGDWYATNLSVKTFSVKNYYEIISPNGNKFLPPPTRCWVFSKEKYKELLEDNRITFGKNGNTRPYLKTFLSEVQQGVVPDTLWLHKDAGHNIEAKSLLRSMFGDLNNLFDTPKPVRLIKRILEISTKKNSIVLDFMAGSGTTGQAVLELNSSDKGSRKFILCTNNENKIAEDICQPRILKVIGGYSPQKSERVIGLGGNLQYFKTDLVKKTTAVQTKLDITSKCTEMLCVKENIFNLEKEVEDWKIFSSNKKEKFLCVYYNFIEKSFDDFLTELKKIKAEKAVYIFSLSDELDEEIIAVVENASLEAIPQKILKVYEEWVKKNVPMRSDLILLEFQRAKERIFDQKDKEEGARLLRIVLEKTIVKISQQNGVEFLKENAKGEKTSILNDKLKGKNIFSKVQWEENKTFLAIGNYAAHGEYDQYELEQVKNFYKHVQALLSKFNLE